ncbi:MAG TPA: PLP-dependent aminotransferase family protein [Pyrinomonadaceae bacterium]
MDLQLLITGKRNLARQIYRQLRERILDGRLKSGERLPASRELAEELAVARKTVTNVYDLLMSEGFLEGRVGSGTFVAAGVARAKSHSRKASPLVVPKEWYRLCKLVSQQPQALPFNFELGVPDTSRFPYPLWRSILGSRAQMLSRHAGAYAEAEGYGPLREAIAKYTAFTRAVNCTALDVVVTNGAQQAFALISHVLINPGSSVAMEWPGYERARWLFESHGARIAEVPVDEEGLIVERLPRNARLVYVTPSHQFPLGVRMSLSRRLALLEWATKHGAIVIEDDYDSEYRFAARPLDSLQSLDRDGVVLYVGTFSKVLFPGVRTGFVISPEPIRSALVAARQLTDWHGPLLTQATLARFIHEGHLARYIRKMRRVYAERRQCLFDCLEAELDGWLKPWPSSAGLHIAVEISGVPSADVIAKSASHLGVKLQPFGQRGLALGYGAIEANEIKEGIRRLTRAIKNVSQRPIASF